MKAQLGQMKAQLAAERAVRRRHAEAAAWATDHQHRARRTHARTSNETLKQLGFAGVLYANLALQSAVRGMQLALGALRRNGQVGEAADFSRSVLANANAW